MAKWSSLRLLAWIEAFSQSLREDGGFVHEKTSDSLPEQ
jgi:hypothetical protein